MFQAVNSRAKFPELEEKILQFWKANGIFEKSIKARKGGPRFVFYEGPPTANGKPGIHHILARAFKDIIPRYRVMKGYYAPRIAGWDTHGLPVELEVEKELGFHNKADIEKFGIAEFNQRCRDSVFRYLKEWDAMTERIAFWVDLKHPYITMKNDYIESVWWAIQQMWQKGLVYQGYRVTPHCPRCGTSLSSHEVALGYQDDTEDPSVYVKFKLVPESNGDFPTDKSVYLLAWTTTPWTLPGNTALAISGSDEYALIDNDTEYLILASARIEATGLDEQTIVRKINGDKLVGLRYQPLFNPHQFGIQRLRFVRGQAHLEDQTADPNLTYAVIATDYVSMEDGTGIVHTAPAYGEDDYRAGLENGLDFVHPVNLQGKITGSYSFAGKFVKTADPLILENLTERNLLYKSGKIRHTYPFCWRCKTPLLYYAKQSWYIRTTQVKERLISGNEEINWYPDHIKHGRFGDWLQNNVDWAFSRERYWGTPVPIWQCTSCGHQDCIGSVAELKKKPGINGLQEPLDMHRPYVDEITYACPECGERMQRTPEVMDCWFDSGAMQYAQEHYPFENETMLNDGRFPADFICEAVDQTRGWFYSLHAEATLLFDQPCFRNVICLGHILDAKGEKMSKSRGNVVEPWEVINKYGADAIRWYCYTAAPPGNVRRFSQELVSDVVRQFLLTLWNVYSFFVMYANIDNYVPENTDMPQSDSELDRWILSELNELIAGVDDDLENYNPTSGGRRIESFVGDLSNWYVRRSRRRFWKSENDDDKLAAYHTLYYCLVTVAKLLAPFMPFVAEEIYRNLVSNVSPDAPESVHLCDFPVADTTAIDKQLINDTKLAMKISSLGRAARSQAAIKVRQPLPCVLVKLTSPAEQASLQRMMAPVLEELNVKELKFSDAVASLDTENYSLVSEQDYGVAVPKDIPEELLREGMAREVVRRIQMMRRNAGFDIADHIITCYQGDEYLNRVMDEFSSYIQQETLSQKLKPEAPADDAHSESFKLSGHQLVLSVTKTG